MTVPFFFLFEEIPSAILRFATAPLNLIPLLARQLGCLLVADDVTVGSSLVVKGKLFVRLDGPGGEEGQVVNLAIGVNDGCRHDLAVGITGMIDPACGSAHVASVDDDAFAVLFPLDEFRVRPHFFALLVPLDGHLSAAN